MKVKVAAIQTQASASPETNLSQACEYVTQAAQQGAQLAVLPENFLNLALTDAQKAGLVETYLKGPIQEKLAECAKANQLWLIAGTLSIKDPEHANPTASSLVFDPQGQVVVRYDKIHLFDVRVGGKDDYKESSSVQAGQQLQVVSTPFGKIGLSICYDLRFPELYRSLMLKGAEILVVPSAFTIPTGHAHWEILIKARAIENQCFVIAPGEVGKRANGLGTYGHSLIVGPWGDTLASMEMQPGFIIAELDLAQMQKIREEFPAISNYQPFVLDSLSNKRKG
jgi:deaminated glutathione amidase